MRILAPLSLLAFLLAASPAPRIIEKLDIAPVWAGHTVGFDLLTHKDHQFVAYYDADRRMTVAWRKLDSQQWSFKVLPTSVVWDSHNYITMAIDDEDCLHLAGNMHVVPLIYFRTSRPLDPSAFEKIPSMLGQNETRCTYPRFFRGPANELIFTYRDGRSGSGNQIYNVYDQSAHAWRRMLDQPLTDGRGKMNAYLNGPSKGPDGYFHLCWVWRNSPDCSTNHTLSYARSKDLRHWETGAGRPLSLPLTVDNADVVDPVPPGGGIINGCVSVGFDSQKRPIIAYHKFDPAGKTQLYNARLEAGRWVIYQTSQWDYRWEFKGGGSINFEIRISPVSARPDGTLTQSYSHIKHGSATFILDEKTLTPTGRLASTPAHPSELGKLESDFPGMRVNWRNDSSPASPYVLRWETLPANRDKAPPQPWPAPSMLRLYKITNP